MTDDIIMRAAKTISPQWDRMSRNDRRNAVLTVRAVLAAVREPSETMCEAGAVYYQDNYQEGHAKEQTTAPLIWRVMIDEALK